MGGRVLLGCTEQEPNDQGDPGPRFSGTQLGDFPSVNMNDFLPSKCLVWVMNDTAQLRLPVQSAGTGWCGGGVWVSRPERTLSPLFTPRSQSPASAASSPGW